MNNKAWAVFIFVQIAGEICFWSCWHISSSAGMLLWSASLVFLFPGNFLSAAIIEPIFWGKKFSVLQLAIIGVPVEILINLAVWFIFLMTLRIIWRKI